MSSNINIRNKKAWFDYEILEKFIAGIQLTGTEIKSIRKGKASLADSYCYFNDNELWIKGMRISEYDQGSYNNHDPYRDRKLLMHRKELNKLEKRVREKGFTLIALRLFMEDNGLAKIEIALGRGKREYDKRETIRRKDMQRDLARIRKIR
jgi:SsrA-binding protein